jgi:hypothetical protein
MASGDMLLLAAGGKPAPFTNFVWALSIFVGWGLFLLAVALFLMRYAKRREASGRKAMEAWASKRGLRFSAADGFDLAKRFGDFWKILAPQGAAGKATNLCWGKVGSGEVILFEQSGPSGYQCACCSCDLPRPVTAMRIRHRGCLDTLGRWFAYHEIQFESAEFNRAWMVEGDDHQAVFEVVTPQVMEFIMGSGIVCLMTTGNRTMAVMLGALTPERCEQLLGQVQGFARQLAGGKVNESGGQPIAT